MGLSVCFVRLVLATGRVNWRLDWDLVATISLLLAPLGPALLTTPLLLWRRPARTWTVGEWLWPASIITSLAWLEVWLDAGLYLGPVAKLICGPTALLLTPIMGFVAVADLLYSLRRRGADRISHWLALAVTMLAAAGCVWFVIIMLQIRF